MWRCNLENHSTITNVGNFMIIRIVNTFVIVILGYVPYNEI